MLYSANLRQPSKSDAQNVNLGRIKGHSSAKAAGLRCMGFYKKKHTFTVPKAHCQKKISGFGSLNRKPKSSMNSALI